MIINLTLVWLHAFGTRYDLPAPLWLFVVGAGAVAFLSFLLIVRRPVLPKRPNVMPASQTAPQSWAQWATLLLGASLALAGVAGTQSIPDNILPTAFWLVFWIAVPISIAIIGNYWPFVSPLHLIARMTGGSVRRAYPQAWGYWPAATLFFLFVCGELIFNQLTTLPSITSLIMITYAALSQSKYSTPISSASRSKKYTFVGPYGRTPLRTTLRSLIAHRSWR